MMRQRTNSSQKKLDISLQQNSSFINHNTDGMNGFASSHRYRTLRKSQSRVRLPRLVDRNLAFHQSQNRIAVKNVMKKGLRLWPLLVRDWFHVLLRAPAWASTLSLLVLWTIFILIFASIYVRIDSLNKDLDCGLGAAGDVIPWPTAFAFSLETCTTVGYGLPGSTNAFFEANCGGVQSAIFVQMLWSMMFNAFLFAFFYAQMSKCELRSFQVVFGNKLCIGVDPEGKVLVKTRCYDVDAQYPVVETHVRMYLMDKHFKLHVLRLVHPDDDMGGMLYTSVPVEIVHHVDHHSALSPPRDMPFVMKNHHGLPLRSVDSQIGNREEIVCPVCGESYGTYERLQRHVEFNKIIEEREDYPIETSHRGFVMPEIFPVTLKEVANHIETNMSEIIVVVEGIDPQVSGTFQALQSYKYNDIAWEADFEPCVAVMNNNFVVDLAKFHTVQLPISPPNSEVDCESQADPDNSANNNERQTSSLLPPLDDNTKEPPSEEEK